METLWGIHCLQRMLFLPCSRFQSHGRTAHGGASACNELSAGAIV